MPHGLSLGSSQTLARCRWLDAEPATRLAGYYYATRRDASYRDVATYVAERPFYSPSFAEAGPTGRAMARSAQALARQQPMHGSPSKKLKAAMMFSRMRPGPACTFRCVSGVDERRCLAAFDAACCSDRSRPSRCSASGPMMLLMTALTSGVCPRCSHEAYITPIRVRSTLRFLSPPRSFYLPAWAIASQRILPQPMLMILI